MHPKPACWIFLIAGMSLSGCSAPAAEPEGVWFTFQVANSTGEPRAVQVRVEAGGASLIEHSYTLIAHSKSVIEEHPGQDGRLRIEVTTGGLNATRTIELVDGMDAIVVLVREDVVEILHTPRPKIER